MTLREISSSTWEKYFSIADEQPKESSDIKTFPPKRSPAKQRFFEEHIAKTTIAPPIESEMDDSVVLRRFMDLPKFIDLIVNHQLVLPTIKKLQEGDPHECEAKPDYSKVPLRELKKKILNLSDYVSDEDLRFWRKFDPNEIFMQPTFVTNDGLNEVLDQMSDEEIKLASWCIEHRRLQNELCCNCWYSNELESDAMWRLYCDRVGVAITTTVERLRKSIHCDVPKMFKEHFKLTLAKVDYNDSAIVASKPSWLVKRMAFRHEHEVRLIIDYPGGIGAGFVLKVDPSLLIQDLTISPYAMRWQAEAIKALGLKVLGQSLRVAPSKHRDSKPPSWPVRTSIQDLVRVFGGE